MSIDRLPPLDLHAHVGDVGAMPLIEGARVFGQTITSEEWDDQSVRLEMDGVVWGLGLHPIFTESIEDVDRLIARLPRCAAVGEVGLDNTGLSPISLDQQRTVLAAILSNEATQDRLVSVHALLAYGETVAFLADYPTPGAILHWFCGPGDPLVRAVKQDLFFSINDAVVADPDQAVVLPDLPRHRVLAETDAPYIDRITGQPLNPWEDTDEERSQGRGLRSGEVRPVEESLGRVWGVEPDEVRWQLWRNLAELESRVKIRPFQASEVLEAAGYDAPVF